MGDPHRHDVWAGQRQRRRRIHEMSEIIIKNAAEKHKPYKKIIFRHSSPRGTLVLARLHEPISSARVYKFIPFDVHEVPDTNPAQNEMQIRDVIASEQKELENVEYLLKNYGKRLDNITNEDRVEINKLKKQWKEMLGALNVISYPERFLHDDFRYGVFLSEIITKTLRSQMVNILTQNSEISLEYRRLIITSVLRGVMYLAKLGLYHQDINSANILIVGNDIKLSDFGSHTFGWQSKARFSGDYAISYKPIELLLSVDLSLDEQLGTAKWLEYAKEAQPEKSDTWAVGCLLAEMVSPKLVQKEDGMLITEPFISPNGSTAAKYQADAINKILTKLGRIKFSELPNAIEYPLYTSEYSSDFPDRNIRKLDAGFSDAPKEEIELMEMLLRYNPQKRPTAKTALLHRYFDVGHSLDVYEEARSQETAEIRKGEILKYMMEQNKKREIERQKRTHAGVERNINDIINDIKASLAKKKEKQLEQEAIALGVNDDEENEASKYSGSDDDRVPGLEGGDSVNDSELETIIVNETGSESESEGESSGVEAIEDSYSGEYSTEE